MVISIAHGVLMGRATYHGMGLHIWQFTPELNSEYYLWIGITSQFYTVGLAGFKSALILLYLQTFGLVSKKFRIICYITLFYTLGYLTANLFVEFLGCWPIAKKWHSELPGHCVNRTVANTFFGIGHVSSDMIIAILPLPPIWKLTFPTTRQKIGLSLTLSSGFMFVPPKSTPWQFGYNMLTGEHSAWAVAVVRYALSTYDQLTYDRPWWAGISFTLSILELNTGLICACVPTFSPLMSVFTSIRVPNFIAPWTPRVSEVWHDSADKARWDECEYHGHLTAERDRDRDRDQKRSKGYSEGTTTFASTDSRDLAAFNSIDPVDDVPPNIRFISPC